MLSFFLQTVHIARRLYGICRGSARALNRTSAIVGVRFNRRDNMQRKNPSYTRVAEKAVSM